MPALSIRPLKLWLIEDESGSLERMVIVRATSRESALALAQAELQSESNLESHFEPRELSTRVCCNEIVGSGQEEVLFWQERDSSVDDAIEQPAERYTRPTSLTWPVSKSSNR